MGRVPGSFLSPRTLRETVLTALIGLAALTVYLSASVPYHTWTEPSEVLAFSPQVPSPVQYVLPVLGTPDAGGYQLAGLLTRALLAVPLGSDATRLRVMGAVLGAMAVVLGVLIIRRLGGGWEPAMGTGLALMFSATLWSRAVVAHPGALTAVLFLGTVLSLFWWVDTLAPVRSG